MERTFDPIADVVVVGTGAAASVTAIEAFDRGNEVLLVEKAPLTGGTSRISAGGMWIPNNRFLRGKGVEDPKEDCLRFMAKASFPEVYHPALPRFGLSARDHALLEAFYDNGSRMMDAMLDKAALSLSGGDVESGRSSYYHYPEDKVPRGRGLRMIHPDGSLARGVELMGQLQEAVNRRGIPVLLNTRAQKIIQNSDREVLGIEATSTPAGKIISIGARKGVVFATGGFAHNTGLMREFLRQPVFGSCAVRECEGDFLQMAKGIGADLEENAHGWWAEVLLEEVLAGPITNDIYVPLGDSMVVVNKYGRRVVSEKLPYHLRTPVHFRWDAVKGEYPNLLLFMIYDKRTLEKFGRSKAVSYPSLEPDSSHVITGSTLEALSAALQERLSKIGRLPSAPSIRLAPDFQAKLQGTVRDFNRYAQEGDDPVFHRGKTPIELDFYLDQGGREAGNPLPNPTMHPLSDQGPYHAIILAAGLLDTHGGPRINARAEVLDTRGLAIPGLYGAGNCVTGPAGRAYWGPGPTLALAMTFGYIAASSVSSVPRKKSFNE